VHPDYLFCDVPAELGSFVLFLAQKPPAVQRSGSTAGHPPLKSLGSPMSEPELRLCWVDAIKGGDTGPAEFLTLKKRFWT